MEIWIDIPNHIDIYQVSNIGRVRSLDRLDSLGRRRRGQILKLRLKDDYSYLFLHENGRPKYHSVHRLVLETFKEPCPEGMECCHNNNNRSDNRLENLRWDTKSNNALDRKKHGTDCSHTINKPVYCIEIDGIFNSAVEAERKTGVSRNSISRACNNKQKTAGGYHWEFV